MGSTHEPFYKRQQRQIYHMTLREFDREADIPANIHDHKRGNLQDI